MFAWLVPVPIGIRSYRVSFCAWIRGILTANGPTGLERNNYRYLSWLLSQYRYRSPQTAVGTEIPVQGCHSQEIPVPEKKIRKSQEIRVENIKKPEKVSNFDFFSGLSQSEKT